MSARVPDERLDELTASAKMFARLREFVMRLPRGYYSDRQMRERREAAKVCICPSHASNRGECPVHDEKGRTRGGV